MPAPRPPASAAPAAAMTPDRHQQEALDSDARFNVIAANAGAAKTTTLAMKVSAFLRQGGQPHEMLVLTYSDAAVRAFRQRLSWLGLSRDVVAALPVKTFAQACHERLVALEGPCELLPDVNRRIHDTVLDAIAHARLRAEQRGFGDAFEIAGDGGLVVPGLLDAFQRLKGSLAVQSLGSEFVPTPDSARDAGLDFTQLAVLLAYERLRRGANARSRDSLGPLFRLEDDPFVDMALVLLAPDPLFAADSHPLKLGLRMLFVDEGHDLNLATFTVLQHLARVNPIQQMFVVGDVDQVVHSASGADPTFMKEAFDRGIGPARRLALPLCRRFGSTLAAPLGRYARKRYDSLEDRDTHVDIRRAADAGAVATLLEGAYGDAQAADAERVVSLAVLLRHPGASVELENELALRGFNLVTHGFVPYLERPEVHFLRVLVAWASGALDTLSHANLSAVHAALGEFTGFMAAADDTQARDIRHPSVEPFAQWVLGDFADFLADAHSPVQPLIRRADRGTTGLLRQFLRPFADGVAPGALAGLVDGAGFRALAKRAFVFDERVHEALLAMRAFARSAAESSSLRDWLQQMANREFSLKSRNLKARRQIRLFTIPAAKGLEFDHVVMPDVDAGAFDGIGQEERNLFYVAASRARTRLTMTFRTRPSSFLQAFGRESDWA